MDGQLVIHLMQQMRQLKRSLGAEIESLKQKLDGKTNDVPEVVDVECDDAARESVPGIHSPTDTENDPSETSHCK